eukprot:1687696-Pleurochrysis_carterae.AAC.1
MPAAELFGAWAVAEAVGTEARGVRPVAVIAVGDCDPAALALNSASSGAAAMREAAAARRAGWRSPCSERQTATSTG